MVQIVKIRFLEKIHCRPKSLVCAHWKIDKNAFEKGQKSKGFNLTFWRFWTIFEILSKGSKNASLIHYKALRFIVLWALLDVYLWRTIFENWPQKFNISKVNGYKLAFLTDFRVKIFWRFLAIKDHKSNSYMPYKSVSIDGYWASIRRLFLEKIDFEKSPKNSPNFGQKVKGLTLTFWRFWTIFEIF